MPETTAKSRILIAGCGDVGTRLGEELVAVGHRVWGLRRGTDKLPPSLRPIAADLTDPSSLENLPEVDLIAYTAAAGGRDEAAYQRAYVDGVRNLLEALEGHSIRRVFFTSSTGVYGQDDGSEVDESSPTEPSRFTGTKVLEGERLLRASPFPSTSVRLSGIYGPGRTRLLDMVRSGRATLTPEPSYTNRIHADDAAGFLAHLVARELRGEPVEEIYVGVDDEPAEKNTVLLWLADRLGAPEPEMGDGSPGRGGNKRCRNDRLKATGYTLRHPTFRDGYGAMIEAMGA